MRIAILDMYNNVPNEGMRCIRQLIERTRQGVARQGVAQTEQSGDLAYDIFNVRAHNALPDLDYDLYISTGGPGVPIPLGEAWEQPYFRLIDQLFAHNQTNESKKYVFLICHSFQLVAGHLGLGEISKRKSTSFGIFPVHKTDEGHFEPLLRQLPDPFFAVDSRDYQLTSPDLDRFDELGAKLLCLEKIRPYINLERAVMAVRFSDVVFGTQFHPEADGDGMLRYFMTAEKRNQIVEVHGAAKYDDMVDHLRDPDKIELTEAVIIPGFLRQAIEGNKLSTTPVNRQRYTEKEQIR